MTLGALYGQCANGSTRLIVAHEEAVFGACAVRPELWESGPKLRVLAMYGRRFSAWRDEGMAALHDVRSAMGADSIVFEGRIGWTTLPGAKALRALYEVKA